MTAALSVRDLWVERGPVPAVRGAALDVPESGWFGLIGANGSGKTSLLRALAGRLPARRGEIRIAGRDLGDDRKERAKAIGFAPDGAMLPAALSAREMFRIMADDADRGLDRLGPLRQALGLDALIDIPVGTCSAGMRQRIAIACAFMGGQRIVILDEPFNWLDPLAAYDCSQALRVLVDRGLTLVTALHDLSTLVSACDSGALLGEGEVRLLLDPERLASARADPAAFERETIDLLRRDESA